MPPHEAAAATAAATAARWERAVRDTPTSATASRKAARWGARIPPKRLPPRDSRLRDRRSPPPSTRLRDRSATKRCKRRNADAHGCRSCRVASIGRRRGAAGGLQSSPDCRRLAGEEKSHPFRHATPPRRHSNDTRSADQRRSKVSKSKMTAGKDVHGEGLQRKESAHTMVENAGYGLGS